MNKLSKKNIEDIFALTSMQEGMLFHHLKNPESQYHFEQLILEICGEVEENHFVNAWNTVIKNNEMLRTVFRWENLEHPVQVVYKEYTLEPLFYDFSNENSMEKKNKPEEVIVNDKQKMFDLREIAFRVTLCKIQPGKYEMIISNHHILYDGWSNGIILKEFFQVYHALSQGKHGALPGFGAKTKFKEFVIWTHSQETKKQEKFWKDYLKNFPASAGGKAGRKKKTPGSTGNYQHRIPGELGDKLFEFVKTRNLTLASLLYAAWGLLLRQFNSTDDVLFDTTIAGRSRKIKGIEDMVGLFINTLPLRVRTNDNQNVLALLSRVHGILQKWEEFENSSQFLIKEYLEKCNWEPLFDSVVILENYPLEKQLLHLNGKLTVNSYSMSGMTNYDITLIITIFDDINLDFTYNKRAFNQQSTAALSRCFTALLEEMVLNPLRKISDIDEFLQVRGDKDKILYYPGREEIDVPGSPFPGAKQEYTAPGNETEEKIAGVWSTVLGIDREKISIDADFFDFGGHSLKASIMASLLHRELHVKIPLSEIFHRPTIRELAQYVMGTGKSKYVAFEAAETKEHYQLSSAQKRFYMLQQADLGSVAYNAYSFMMMEGKPRKDKLDTVFANLVQRHESLRTVFTYLEKEQEPVQKIVPVTDFKVRYLEAANHELQSLIPGFIQPFDLTKAPLMRVELIKLTGEEQKYLLLFDMHHIISDGSSVNILIREFMELYQENELPLQPFQYKDFSEWQNKRLNSGKFKQEKEFWLNQFSGELPVLNMPLDYPRPLIHSFEGERLTFYLEKNLVYQLEDFTAKTSTTLYMVLLAGLSILLSKYSRQQDIIVGTPVAGRDHRDLLNVFGLLLEMIIIRAFPQEHKTIDVYLQEVKRITLKSYENQSYPFGEWLKQVAAADDMSRNPLFDVMLIVQNQGRPKLEVQELKISPFQFENHTSKVDINLEVFEIQEEKDKRIRLELEYCTALFKQETMEKMICHLTNILREVVKAPGQKLSSLDMMDQEEKQQILEVFNKPGIVPDGISDHHRQLHELFERQVEQNPDRMAVVGPGQPDNTNALVSLTYKVLNKRSDRVAGVLREKGVQADTIVGIKVERSLDMMIGILGILKAGGAYLPIDPAYPQERINYILKDSGASILLSEGLHFDVLSSHLCTFTSSFLSPSSLPSSLAYILYTSGTTGNPKGVMVEHANVMNVVNWFARTFHVEVGTHILQLTVYTFDPSVEDFFATLLHGAVLYIAEPELMYFTEKFCCYVDKHQVHIVNYVPFMLNKLLSSEKKLESLQVVISGGERLEDPVKDSIIGKGYVLYNNYGPTEVTVDALCAKCTQDKVTLGRPIDNVSCYIMDTSGYLVPVGIPGELSIAGAGIARGYLNRPGLTREKFLNYKIQNTNYKLYKTGDLARWLTDGTIEFLGRMDRQVKVRGFRVELAEIERRLLEHEDIMEAVVLANKGEEDSTRLCAYFTFTAKKELLDPVPALIDYLSGYLPAYMIPSYFIQLEQIPLTSSGKPDVRKLPVDVDNFYAGTGAEYVSPRTESEKKLGKIWQEILKLEKISIKDNFFQLGGDSIRMIRAIVRIRESMHREIPLKTFFENPTIESLSRIIDAVQQDKEKVPAIRPTPRDKDIPLSFSQERIWFLQRLYDDYMSYHVPRAIRIKGHLHIELMERTFTEIIRRHEILRTVFPTRSGKPVQNILPPYPLRIPVKDLTHLTGEQQQQAISRFIVEEGQQGFDFEQGPMIRISLLKLESTEHMLISVEHHLVHDGWTQGVMLQEFIAIYSDFIRGKPSPLPELPIQFADFAVWQRQYMQGERLERHLAYWKNKLAGLPPLLELPADRPRPSVISGKGTVKRFTLSSKLTADLNRFAASNDVTLFMTMLTTFKVLLFRYTGIEDLCVGTGTANRRSKEMEGMLGMVINTLALRTRVQGELTFIECLKRVKDTCLQAYEHEDTPFEKVVDAIRPERSLSYTPIFQVMFSFMDTPTREMVLPGLELHLEDAHNRSSKFDISIVVVPGREESPQGSQPNILIEWEYSTDIFEDAAMERMLRHYHHLLHEIPCSHQKKISVLSMIEKSEIHRLLYELNNTATDYPKHKSIHQLFVEQAGKFPDHIALVGRKPKHKQVPGQIADLDELNSITYNELNKNSHQLAAVLKEKGVGPDSIVPLMIERSIEMIICILGILKAGGAYMPIDTEYPGERINYMLEDSGAELLVTSNSLVKEFKNRRRLQLEENLRLILIDSIDSSNSSNFLSSHLHDFSTSQSSNLAYVIYTSGTTGKPKGILTNHYNVVRVVKQTNYVVISERDRVMQLSNYAFDGSVYDIYGALLNGAALVLAGKEDLLAIDQLSRLIKKEHITTFFITASLFNTLADLDIHGLSNVRKVIFGGEQGSVPHARKALEHLGNDRIINGYGPTETTVFATFYSINAHNPPGNSIPIGRPLSNTSIYILDKDLNPQPPGIRGEIYIGGDGLARGYLNRPRYTREKFVDNPFAPNKPKRSGDKLYRSGDIGCRLPDGNIEFLGRIDHQVKIRGFRIELGEIEAQLLKHNEIKEAIVMVKQEGNGKKNLCAYLTAVKELSTSELREYVSGTLPGFMVPSYFIQLQAMPLTVGGKLDRKALDRFDIKASRQDSPVKYVEPATRLEKTLGKIWQEVLDVEKVSIYDNFFDLGGSSMNVIHLNNRLKEALNRDIPVVAIYRYMTINAFARYLTRVEAYRDDFKKETDRSGKIKKGKHRLRKKMKKVGAFND